MFIFYGVKKTEILCCISNDITDRLRRHNNGESLNTRGGIPWKLLHVIECEDKSAAMLLEARIKKRGIGRFLSDNNIESGL